HVVAAEQQVIADRLSNETHLPLLLDRLDEREVARPAADIDDEATGVGGQIWRAGSVSDRRLNLRILRSLTLPALPVPRIHPAIERRLRLLQQRHVFQSGLLGGFDGEIAGDVVE